MIVFFFFQAEDGIRDIGVTGVQTCALPIFITQIKSENGGRISFRDIHTLNLNGEEIVVSQAGKVIVADNEYEVSSGSILRVKEGEIIEEGDRKSTRLNSSHANISYAVFCLKKKKITHTL